MSNQYKVQMQKSGRRYLKYFTGWSDIGKPTWGRKRNAVTVQNPSDIRFAQHEFDGARFIPETAGE